ncbi:hypothetical protein [Tautonia plasticadhaerens]|uniref:Uncharacterized protein n=1 Tax=Tautonia plasticadhaerens TaxID=2527974 RepID=A0A518HFL2_9BACT|nr:hypothetical protein [Tautonia plasticadhaerens]QDV39618.1 hypothetical protein ElP_75890 [Tautonia plasticadhaerens]
MDVVEECRIGERGGDPLRRVALGALALYLTPALLIVLLIGALGMACCAAARLLGGDRRGPIGPSRRDATARGIPAPHVIEACRSRSSRH